ncbi:TrmH family RNA methyltransferase [Winogradskyella echinorum]|uniref:TrmH family RNA methyltransferase n=1 Tax=Winogradskyella echinorum TaxID=538189 RepID=A0ABR6Y1E6_9FLAO|nr:TrmH family RNA methyltransferase [Winogradskyella echinorum]MBC3846533.1 TrmH family RNA methyltransferase [Winogradskyella echinorum]MBC5750881.1 TrmH family RNA methyltransferase [Winogradskyella echinorum]
MQLTHRTSNFKKLKHPITIVCDNITNAPNIGSLFRIADAFGIEKLIFCGKNVSLGKRMTKTSRSTEKYVDHKIETNINSVITDLKTKNYFLLALEITENSQELSQFALNTNQPIAIILGDENFGVSEDILNQCDAVTHINMYGNNSSMNVVQATSITLYELTKQLNS